MTALRIVAVLVALGALPATASAGTITGRVTDQISGAPVANLQVGTGPMGQGLKTYTTTDADGRYTFDGLEADEYGVCFLPTNRMNLLKRCWRDEEKPFYGTDVVVPEAGVIGDVDTVLAPGTSVAGTVVDWEGRPLAGVCVVAWAPQSGGWGRKGDTMTGADGSYTLAGLTPGDGNRILFGSGQDPMARCAGWVDLPGVVSQWFDRKPSLHEAQPVVARRSETVGGIDGILGPQAVPPQYALPRPSTCTVPQLRNRSFATARRRLARAGCSTPMPALKASRRYKRGRVISTYPKARKRVERGRAVRLIVSRGR